ncbi:hypothetical protein JCM31826_17010 [Thermaurantimonas aggregans]|uniref:Uncharacterized protein n=2 Tax=Schleiferiaceae TaxID=1333713 RepID=A0A401XMH0_9FLAO|nr:hypothetical protein JCM31826_17010 [Thermaurantimonas aggregans]
MVYIFPAFIVIFLIYFRRFRFIKSSILSNGYFSISNNSLIFYSENGNFFKEIPFNELSKNILFKHIFSYDEKNIQAILKLTSGENWTIMVDQSGADAIKNLKWEIEVDSKALKKIPFYMHFVAFIIISSYLLMIYFYLTNPEELDVRNTILFFTTLPFLFYYYKLIQETKTTKSEK